MTRPHALSLVGSLIGGGVWWIVKMTAQLPEWAVFPLLLSLVGAGFFCGLIAGDRK
jgi:hypothetical protein